MDARTNMYPASTDVDLMHGEGDGLEDEYLEDNGPQRVSFACVAHPSNKGRAYFFCLNRYALVDIASGPPFDATVEGPDVIVKGWPSLVEAGFATVDAILPVPGSDEKLFVFSGEQSACVHVASGTTADLTVNKGVDIAHAWPALKEAGFNTVDAVLPNPANNEEAFFFSGESWALLRVAPAPREASIVEGLASIYGRWPAFQQAGFRVVDAILHNPANFGEAFAFSGEEYALININGGTSIHCPKLNELEPQSSPNAGVSQSSLVRGPKLIRDDWLSLHKAGFW
ncbi:hypothetical protein C8Q79DRAFT_982320 [Trametes meyenii]|nr:hypothetical protein C8Q79DRAFT_982320 [Trametes meyenii]